MIIKIRRWSNNNVEWWYWLTVDSGKQNDNSYCLGRETFLMNRISQEGHTKKYKQIGTHSFLHNDYSNK